MIFLRSSRRRDAAPLPRPRRGVSLVEIVVACTLLALTLTGLTHVAAKMAQRTRDVAVAAQRNAIVNAEVNRVESMFYDSLGTYLVSDSLQQGTRYFVWTYTVDAESTTVSGTNTGLYRKITLTITPRSSTAGASSMVIRRSKPPVYNPLLGT